MNRNDKPFDYLEAIEQLRKEMRPDKSQIQEPDIIPVQIDEPVDYIAASKAWDKAQEGKNKIHLQTGKRNPSHDPIVRRF